MRFFVEMGENEEKPAAKWALREMDEERMVSGLMDTALREAELAVNIPPKGKSKRRYYS